MMIVSYALTLFFHAVETSNIISPEVMLVEAKE